MIQFYELYFILNPDLKSEEIQSEIDSIVTKLGAIGSQEITTESQGVKKFAYPINKRQSGFYVLINFQLDIDNTHNLNNFDKGLNLNQNVWRYLLLNITKDLKLKAKEKLNQVDITSVQEMNSGKKVKKDFISFLGMRVVDYKDADLLSQFMSPYAKIFKKTRLGTKSKNQRKISKAIKRARHMGLLPFTALYSQD